MSLNEKYKKDYITEIHTIRPFRGRKVMDPNKEQGSLGIIRLDKLSYPSDMKIDINGIEINPIAYDTYGHPIVSASNFDYYKALKRNADRRSDTFLTKVTYRPKPFCVKRAIYDSEDAIKKAAIIDEKKERGLKDLKELLIYRKQAAFCKLNLDTYLLYGKYILSNNGHVYWAKNIKSTKFLESVVAPIKDEELISKGEEFHVPDEGDVCAVCGKSFILNDVKEGFVSENEKFEKIHEMCHYNFTLEVNQKNASAIVDSVYEGNPEVKIVKEWDEEDQTEKVWYVYETYQGTIAIRLKRKVIVIKWFDNFKPFNMALFEAERVTKFDRGIHAWSKDDAIRYLEMAKKA